MAVKTWPFPACAWCRAATWMQRMVRLEAKTNAGEVKTTELATFSRPAMISTLAEIGLVLAESKTLLARLQMSMLCGLWGAAAAQGAAHTPAAGLVRHGRG